LNFGVSNNPVRDRQHLKPILHPGLGREDRAGLPDDLQTLVESAGGENAMSSAVGSSYHDEDSFFEISNCGHRKRDGSDKRHRYQSTGASRVVANEKPTGWLSRADRTPSSRYGPRTAHPRANPSATSAENTSATSAISR
jgi:hypothetical protein